MIEITIPAIAWIPFMVLGFAIAVSHPFHLVDNKYFALLPVLTTSGKFRWLCSVCIVRVGNWAGTDVYYYTPEEYTFAAMSGDLPGRIQRHPRQGPPDAW